MIAWLMMSLIRNPQWLSQLNSPETKPWLTPASSPVKFSMNLLFPDPVSLMTGIMTSEGLNLHISRPGFKFEARVVSPYASCGNFSMATEDTKPWDRGISKGEVCSSRPQLTDLIQASDGGVWSYVQSDEVINSPSPPVREFWGARGHPTIR